jgi:uncharacterized membrane protein (UPF0127 family)
MNVLHVRGPDRAPLAMFVAERYGQRLLGLIGLRALPPGSGIFFPDCRSIHTFGTRFPIDVLFVTVHDRSLHVHDARRAVPPFRVVRASPEARSHPRLGVLELAAQLPASRC